MGWEQYIKYYTKPKLFRSPVNTYTNLDDSRRNTLFFSTAALLGSYLTVRYRQAEQEKKNAQTFHVSSDRSGELQGPIDE